MQKAPQLPRFLFKRLIRFRVFFLPTGSCRQSEHYEKEGIMNIWIIYASKTGTTRDCAEKLATLFSLHRVTCVDIEKEIPDIREADVILVGTSVRMGRIATSVRKFLTENHEVLLTVHLGLFLCCGFCDNAESYFKNNYAADLLEHADSAMTFGGEMRVERQKGFDKLIAKLVLRSIASHNRDEDREHDIPLPALIPENIRRFADEIRSAL